MTGGHGTSVVNYADTAEQVKLVFEVGSVLHYFLLGIWMAKNAEASTL